MLRLSCGILLVSAWMFGVREAAAVELQFSVHAPFDDTHGAEVSAPIFFLYRRAGSFANG